MGLKEVFKKVSEIKSESVELESHKVDLGLIDEISKELQLAFNSQDIESDINNAIMKLQKSLPIYKQVIVKCDKTLAMLKELGGSAGADKKVLEQKNEALSMSKSIENRIVNLNKNRK